MLSCANEMFAGLRETIAGRYARFAFSRQHRGGSLGSLFRFGATSRVVATIFAASFLAGCGGDDEAAPSATGGGGAGAPTISGAPTAVVMHGQPYSFTPTANDPNGDTLTFSISGMPSWATFSSSNGRLSGTPGAGDVATYSNITIRVSDGTTTVALPSFSVQVVAVAMGSVTLNWQPPTQNTDGTPLTNLAGYKVYWGTSPGAFSNSVTLSNPGLTSYVVEQLTPATWYFAATSVNAQNVESAFTRVVSKRIP
jgi:hypothetical protein